MLQKFEEYKVHNLDEKDHEIIRDDKLSTMMQQQEEDKVQKLMEK